MDKSTTTGSEVRDARDTIGKYSDLHDASLAALSLRQCDQVLTIGVAAEEYVKEAEASITLACRGVRSFRILRAPVEAAGFEDYRFPVNSLIDGAAIESRDGLVHVHIHGTYG